jgi:small nuclear ribonucleoprotein (snRNP)-like protein
LFIIGWRISRSTRLYLSLTQNLFKAYFQSLIEHECAVDLELKNNVTLTGKLTFIDNNMCLLLEPTPAQLGKLPPQFAGMRKGLYVRGSALRMAFIPKIEQYLESLTHSCRQS